MAVNFAIALAEMSYTSTSIVDLDIVNPYFRCREVSEILEEAGIKVVCPKGEFKWADMPIILPEIKGLLEGGEGYVVLDVGGNDVGARVLASLSGSIDRKGSETLFVLNTSRPFTRDVAGAIKMIGDVAKGGDIEIKGLVVNPHLIDETTPDIIYNGVDVAGEVSEKTGIPIRFVSVMKDLTDGLDIGRIGSPVFPMERRMLPPWR